MSSGGAPATGGVGGSGGVGAGGLAGTNDGGPAGASGCTVDACNPPGEPCDGIDNDCDGIVDNSVLADLWCATTAGNGKVCRDGGCVCALMCAGDCIDPASDARNCGVCGKTCPVACAGGNCVGATDVGMGVQACVLLADGSVECWGPNTPSPIGLQGITSISIGDYHGCAVGPGGMVWCWGSNDKGALGRGCAGGGGDRFPLGPVTGLSGAHAVAVGIGDYSCTLLSDHRVECWGANDFGQLGDGTTTERHVPTPVKGLSGVVALAVGNSHTCAVRADGTLWCWGDRGHGALGDGVVDTAPVKVPQEVPGVSGAVAVTCGFAHTCVLLQDGSVQCWGGTEKELAVDGTGMNHVLPAPVPGLSEVTEIRAAQSHTCALMADGTVDCWGNNFSGALGDGTIKDHYAPAPVVGITNAIAIDVGVGSSCAVLKDASVECWGGNFYGQLGDGTKTPRTLPARVVWP